MTHLQSAGQCFYSTEEYLLVMNDAEEEAKTWIGRLELFEPSDACRSEITPLLCLYLFGLCSTSGDNIQLTLNQCQEVRDVVCVDEWSRAVDLKVPLPDCESFPSTRLTCNNFTNTNLGMAVISL